MRIFLDTTSVCERGGPHVTGIQRAILGIWSGLIVHGSEVIPLRMDRHEGRWVRAQASDFSELSVQLLPAGSIPIGPETHPSHALPWLGRLRGLLARLGLACPLDPAPAPNDVFLIGAMGWMCRHGDRATRPIARTGAVIAPLIHDIYPIVHPEWVDAEFAAKYERWFASLLRQADLAYCVSSFTAAEVNSYCRRAQLPALPMTVVRLGDEHALDLGCKGVAAPPCTQGRRRSLVYVSTVDPRKNHQLLVESWRLLASRRPTDCPDLTWVGGGGEYAEGLWERVQDDPALRGRIAWRRDVTDIELASILDECLATIYPSRYEGWGLPVAESLARGRICLAARAASLPEICPAATPLFDPDDPAELAELVERLLDDPDWVRHLHDRTRAEFVPTTWRMCASQILAAVGDSVEAEAPAAQA